MFRIDTDHYILTDCFLCSHTDTVSQMHELQNTEFCSLHIRPKLCQTGYVYMQPNNLFVIRLMAQTENPSCKHLIDPIERGGLFFSNVIERACKPSIRLKTETERTVHVQ